MSALTDVACNPLALWTLLFFVVFPVLSGLYYLGLGVRWLVRRYGP